MTINRLIWDLLNRDPFNWNLKFDFWDMAMMRGRVCLIGICNLFLLGFLYFFHPDYGKP